MRAWIVAGLIAAAVLWVEAEAEDALGWTRRASTGVAPLSLRPSGSLVHLACVTFSPMAIFADEALLRRVHSGDISALEALYRLYEGAIFNLARRLCASEADADDVLQDTFVEVGKSLDRYRGQGPLVSWMKRICVSKALMRLRRSARFPEEPLDERNGAEPFRGRLDIEKALSELSPLSRAVLWLHDVEGYTHEEIASLLNRSVSFSKSQLSRGHARLRALLADEGKDPTCGI